MGFPLCMLPQLTMTSIKCFYVFFFLQGAQEIFQQLPHEYVEPEHLPKIAKAGCRYQIVIMKPIMSIKM